MQTKPSFWQRRTFWGIRIWELAAFAGVHSFLAVLYIATIWLTVGQNQWNGITLNYTLKMVLTAPLWWLFFRRLRHWSLLKKMWLHLPACAVYVGAWLVLFYALVDWWNWGRLQGRGIWWDVYIPALVYFIQFGIFHAYAYWTQTVRQAEREKDLLRATHTAEMNALKAQIQPHFLFNTLNSISASVSDADERPRELIAQLADVFRFAMKVADKETVPLAEELQFIKAYLALEQFRFGDRLTVSYNVDAALHSQSVPPFLLQPLVENAVKHGIAKSITGGSIAINIKQEKGCVHFDITDTGKGINGTPQEALFQKGIGLENTRLRLLRQYGASLQVSNVAPTGCRVHFHLPLHQL